VAFILHKILPQGQQQYYGSLTSPDVPHQDCW